MHKDDTSTPPWTNLDDMEAAPPKNLNYLPNPHIEKVHLYSPIRDRQNKALLHQNQTIVNFFQHIVNDDARVHAIAGDIIDNLNEIEIETFSKYLKTINLEKIAPKYDTVTPEIITKMEYFVGLIKKKDLTVFESFKDTNVDLYQELRLSFSIGKILKNKLTAYFNALHSLKVSPTMMMKHLRVIEPKLFSDDNLKNKKKAAAAYLLQ